MAVKATKTLQRDTNPKHGRWMNEERGLPFMFPSVTFPFIVSSLCTTYLSSTLEIITLSCHGTINQSLCFRLLVKESVRSHID